MAAGTGAGITDPGDGELGGEEPAAVGHPTGAPPPDWSGGMMALCLGSVLLVAILAANLALSAAFGGAHVS